MNRDAGTQQDRPALPMGNARSAALGAMLQAKAARWPSPTRWRDHRPESDCTTQDATQSDGQESKGSLLESRRLLKTSEALELRLPEPTADRVEAYLASSSHLSERRHAVLAVLVLNILCLRAHEEDMVNGMVLRFGRVVEIHRH